MWNPTQCLYAMLIIPALAFQIYLVIKNDFRR